MTSIDLRRTENIELVKADSGVNRSTNKKRKLKSGCVHEIGEKNDEYLDEILRKNNL